MVNSCLLSIRQTDIIEEGVLSSIEWCLNEAMDNVLQHSGVGCGYMMAQVLKSNKQFSVCIFDVGMGIFNSLKHSKHRPKTRLDAITMALQEKVTRDESIGQGNGLWGLSQILETGQGYLQISSSGARYCRERDGQISTVENGSFNLGKKCGTTLVDFQLNYGNAVNIAEVLTGYEPVDLWLENLVDSNGDIVLKIAEQAGGTGTRLSAEKLRNLIVNLALVDNKKVILDFAGINLISSSFADELIGKIIAKYGFVLFTKKFQIENLTPLNISVLNRSVQQRMAQSYYDSQLEDKFDDD